MSVSGLAICVFREHFSATSATWVSMGLSMTQRLANMKTISKNGWLTSKVMPLHIYVRFYVEAIKSVLS